MNYFKVIKDGKVIDVGFSFLKWNTSRHKFYVCDLDEAQFVQGFNLNTVYRAEWLKAPPAEAGVYDPVDIAFIEEDEYNDLRAMLEEGEEIHVDPDVPEPPPEPDPEPEPGPEPEPEKPMTIAEMRMYIEEMFEQMNLLTECILEMSEVVYSG